MATWLSLDQDLRILCFTGVFEGSSVVTDILSLHMSETRSRSGEEKTVSTAVSGANLGLSLCILQLMEGWNRTLRLGGEQILQLLQDKTKGI